MIKREDLAVVEDASVIEGIETLEQEIDKLLSNEDVLRYKEFKLLFLVYDDSKDEMKKKVLDRSKRSEYDRIFYIDISSKLPGDESLRKQISGFENMIVDAGFDLKKETVYISDRVWTVWTVTWK